MPSQAKINHPGTFEYEVSNFLSILLKDLMGKTYSELLPLEMVIRAMIFSDTDNTEINWKNTLTLLKYYFPEHLKRLNEISANI